ncbi:transferrin 2-like [Metopolophium dirhodum]|uniref:transferrin 2-like n=1 Tax=Metopolophium dirhodum TaxID=44670 RepID=UPI00298FCAF5|nr:transferrin 2-like [Metopolophium dirhodum]
MFPPQKHTMKTSNNFLTFLAVCLVLANIAFVHGDISDLLDDKIKCITWCTLNVQEQSKCLNLSAAVNRDRQRFNPRDFMDLICKPGLNKDDCMMKLDNNAADILSLDAGEVFVGGRYNGLIPLMQQIFEDGSTEYYSVALIKKNTLKNVYNLGDLKGKKACFAGVGTQAGWNVPINTLISKGYMKIVDCNNHVKTTIEFFGNSCAVNSLLAMYNPMGDNSARLCILCASKVSGQKCTSNDPYAGDEGAFRCLIETGDITFLRHTTVLEMLKDPSLFRALRCLVEGGGNVAFVKHTTVYENVGGRRKQLWARNTLTNDFELLCPDGKSSIHDYKRCSLGKVKANAVITRGGEAYNHTEVMLFINLLMAAQQWYGMKTTIDKFTFSMFKSPEPYSDLIFQDATQQLASIDSSLRHYSEWLGENFMLERRLVDCHAPGSNL